MDVEQTTTPEISEAAQSVPDAPSPRAGALRKELFGSALTLDETAYILSLDRTTVAKYLRERSLFGFQIGREWLIPEEELRAYVSRVYRTAASGGREAGVEEREAPPTGDEGASRPVDVIQRNLFSKLFPRGKEREKSGSLSRFDRFSDSARQVLALAQEEATRFNHNYIGTEHLLLGLIREDEGVAGAVLANLGADTPRVRHAVEYIIGRGDQSAGGEIGLTPRAKKVIELAVDEARLMDHQYIGVKHLLLGLIREGNGIAAGVLQSLGVTEEGVRTQIVQILAQRRGAPAQASPPEVPAEAAALVAEGEQGHPCPRCSAMSPGYFRYCFNCGEHLQEVSQPEGGIHEA